MDLALEEEPLWQLAKRIVASKGFAKSKFLKQFVLYICEMHLTGRCSELTEQMIGERVFKRAAGYRPGDDNIVRNYARLLRQRLDEYFEGEGREESIRIYVPRGGYSPHCVEAGKASEEATAMPPASSIAQAAMPGPNDGRDSHVEPSADGRAPRLASSLWIAVALCAVLCLSAAWMFYRVQREKAQERPESRFWSALFTPNRDTLIIPADSGLVIYQDLTRKRVHLAEYAAGEYRKEASSPPEFTTEVVNDLGGRRYTSFVDLEFVAMLSRLPEVQTGRFKIQYARETSIDEIKQSTVVLIGSSESNPWVELFQKELNFQFESVSGSSDMLIRNRRPAAGEQSSYVSDRSDPAHATYGLIAVTPGLDGAGHVLIVEGINMAGTEAAADYLFSEQMTALLPKLINKKKEIVPFEILLRTSNIGANAVNAKLIALRIGAVPAI